MGFNVAIRLLLVLGVIQVIAARWTPIAKTKIITNMLLSYPGVTESYMIPHAVPHYATDVLFYASVECGRTSPQASQSITIFTKGPRGSPRYKKYLLVHSYPQAAWSFNSDNMWLPLTRNRRVYVYYPKAMKKNTGCRFSLDAIGYKY